MAFPLNDLGEALTTQLYQSIMGGDNKVPPPKDKFFTWCVPGLAFNENDFDFCETGLLAAPDGSPLTAEESRRLDFQAYQLAMLLDFIPDVGMAYTKEEQQGAFSPDAGKRLSVMYGEILRNSKVVHREPSEEEQKEIERLQNKLTRTVTRTDPVTDEIIEAPEDSPMVKAYTDYMERFDEAQRTYTTKMISAAVATGADGLGAVTDWRLNGDSYLRAVTRAGEAWAASGYRNAVNEIRQMLNQASQRGMVFWKSRLEEQLRKGMQNTNEGNYAYTTLVPPGFAKAKGWTTLGIKSSSTAWANHNKTSSWEGGLSVPLPWGFSVGASAGGSREETKGDVELSSFEMEFAFTQTVIVRPWFYPEWFDNRGWTLEKGDGWTFDQMPSDGKRPPAGEFVGYPVQAIFVRDVKIKSEEFVSHYNKVASSSSGGGSIGWGPFSLKGTYSRSQTDEEFESDAKGEWLKIPGMQIIAFVNQLLGKAPNLLPELKDADFV